MTSVESQTDAVPWGTGKAEEGPDETYVGREPPRVWPTHINQLRWLFDGS